MTSRPTEQRQASGILLGGALAIVWSLAISRCAPWWSTAPDYHYGWLVPLLAGYLFFERWPQRPEPGSSTKRLPWMTGIVTGSAALVATRFCLEPFPFWPGMLWLHTGAAVMISLCLLGRLGGHRWARHFAFPFVFFLTALPWPEFARQPFTASAAGWVAQIAALVVNEFAGPAVRHGNVIELSHGMLGVEEACTGLRSLESLVMAALFVGEFFRLTLARRVACVAISVVLAFAANVSRTTALAWGAAARGMATVEAWHDAAGYAALLLTLPAALWIGWWWRSRETAVPPAASGRPNAGLRFGAVAVACGVVVASEALPRWWFGGPAHRETWTIALPQAAADYRRVPFSSAAYSMLRCSEGGGASWRTEGTAPRAAYYARWTRGHHARFALELHNPTVCLPLAGAESIGPAAAIDVAVGGHALSFQGSAFRDGNGSFVIYNCALVLPDATPLPPAPITGRDWIRWRWQTILHRQRDEHVLLLAIALWEPPSSQDELAQSLAAEVRRILVIRG